MKNIFVLIGLMSALCRVSAQIQKNQQDTLNDSAQQQQIFLKQFSDKACSCIDSISILNKGSEEISKDISACIDSQTITYQIASKLADVAVLTDNKNQKKENKEMRIAIDTLPQSPEYLKYYRRLERYLVDSCQSLRAAMGQNNKESKNSVSSRFDALTAYGIGQNYMSEDDYENAVVYFEKAVALDDTFAFAWDNIGICYRNLGNYDKALSAYQKSLSLVPDGETPLQNIPVVYEFQKKYDEAIKAYQNFQKIRPNNPEGYYGAGRIYFIKGNNTEALRSMCQAYLLYAEQQSPYRTDAETMLQNIYNKMKGENQLDDFINILNEFNLSQALE